jgi:DNA ligase-1
MSAKRRKKNDSEPSPRPVRSLDFFFGKKTQKQELNKLGKDEQGEGIDELAGSQSEMTDEQYARKLQHEWNRQAETADTAPFEPPPPPSFGSPPGKGLNVSVGGTLTTNSIPSTGSKLATLSLQSGSSIEDAVTASVPIDESPLTFDPALYLPGLKEKWAEHGGAASYALLTRCFVLVNSTQSRIKIVDNLTNLIRTIIEGDPESLNPAVWLATNAISPPYISLELGLGGSAISKALKKVYGLDSGGLKSLYDKHGDAGDVAFEAKKRQAFTLRKPKHLSIQGVYQSLVQIANSKGTGSQEFKQRIVERLLQDCQGAEESRVSIESRSMQPRRS